MISRFLSSILAMMLWGASQAQAQGGPTLNVAVQGYELPMKHGAAVLGAQEAQFDARAALLQLTQAKAKIVKLGTLSTKSGQRASVKEAGMALEVDATLGPAGDMVAINLAVQQEGRSLTTAATVMLDTVYYLGNLEDAEHATVTMIFMRISAK